MLTHPVSDSVPSPQAAIPKSEDIFWEDLKKSQMESQTGRKLCKRLAHNRYVCFGALQGSIVHGKAIQRFALVLKLIQVSPDF